MQRKYEKCLEMTADANDFVPVEKFQNEGDLIGVTQNGNGWEARIFVGSERKSLGTFDTVEQASKARKGAQAMMDAGEVPAVVERGPRGERALPTGVKKVDHKYQAYYGLIYFDRRATLEEAVMDRKKAEEDAAAGLL